MPAAPMGHSSHDVPAMREVTLAYQRVHRGTLSVTDACTPATQGIAAPPVAPMGDFHAAPAQREVTVSSNSGKAHPPRNNQPRMG
jgi:hypothetical protein